MYQIIATAELLRLFMHDARESASYKAAQNDEQD